MKTETNAPWEENPNLKQAREHFRAARRSMYKSWEKLLPEGLLDQHRAARRELLLGFRKMLDFAIEKSEKSSGAAAPQKNTPSDGEISV